MTKQIDMTKFFNWITAFDLQAAHESIAVLKATYPTASRDQLIQKIFTKTQWQCAASGLITGLPSNIVAMIPAALLDIGITIKYEIHATSQVALLHDENFFNDDGAKWKLLVPIFGINIVSQIGQEAAVKGGKKITEKMIHKYLEKEAPKQIEKALVKVSQKKTMQKATATKTVPIIGGVIGGTWNWIEVIIIEKRTLRYFDENSVALNPKTHNTKHSVPPK